MADPYLQGIRRALGGARESRGGVPVDWQKGESGNHEFAIVVGNYSLDPHGFWRRELIDWLINMLTVKGLWCSRFDDEFGTTSHKAHWYAAQDALLYFALLYGDDEMLALIMRLECGVHAIESLCATPKGDIVMTGARCHFGDPKAADQREQGNRRWQWLMERKVKLPKLLSTADDWMGLYCLTLVRQLEGGANKLKTIALSLTPGLLHNAISIERGQHGHVVRMETVNGCMRPALWAVANYDTGEELYGVDPSWPKEYRGAKLGDVPLPRDLPSGKVTTIKGTT